MENLIEIGKSPIANVLELLLKDKSTKKNIIWATDTYEELGEEFADTAQINPKPLLWRSGIIRPRIQKSEEEQSRRTRKKAEVFTPTWLCNKMNNRLDEDWFGRKNVFNAENADNTWTLTEGKIEFPKGKKWQDYVDSRRLEITCGEAPYLISRYDVSTGEKILPPLRRIGILDRKLRIVNENTDTYEAWLKWTIRAFEASYGYEYQGDNVLIARINMLLTFVDYHCERWGKQPDPKLLRQISNVIAQNIWQMDGIKDTVPLGKPYREFRQLSLLDMLAPAEECGGEPEAVPCKIYNHRSKASLRFMDLKRMGTMEKKLFDYVIGNPPYQEDTDSDSTRMPPVYNHFMEQAYSVADAVELITPARFLFNAGYTPKEWNKKMLNDEHFKVMCYEPDSSKVFSNTEIKGGIAISYRDANKVFGAIEIFTAFPELNSILKKVKAMETGYLDEIISSPLSYKVTEKMVRENPDLVDRLRSSAFTKLARIFFEEKPADEASYISMIGLFNNKRVTRYVRADYIEDTSGTLNKYTLLLPKANGSGKFGETLAPTVLAEPGTGYTQTFIGMGKFDCKNDALNLDSYLKCKFTRAMLGILKITQDCPAPKWKFVPLQDFTSNSDIDWSVPVGGGYIDKQLYRKYGLDEKEIEFIETHVKEMV